MKTIAIDFDGVIHSYTSPWTKAEEITDPPVPGAIEFLKDLIYSEKWDVCIFSTRNETEAAVDAMRRWLRKYSSPDDLHFIDRIRFPIKKPSAFVGLDDRVITFTGTWPSYQELEKFKPWNKR